LSPLADTIANAGFNTPSNEIESPAFASTRRESRPKRDRQFR
jgi:hypothetical protein